MHSNAIRYNDIDCSMNMIKHNSVDTCGQDKGSTINDDETEYLEDILH